MYTVFNQTDGIYATPDTFRTRRNAEKFIRSFRRRFIAQGFYLTFRRERIAIDEVQLEIEGVEDDEADD